ncbi:multifunctional methyltransferase subunit TRM112-like protein [Parasteatoda tepidariorum]|uniref:Multifunctional methyltransferase subunit TRM112-like protein n=1 Tax=Parasteatoda tepidariorum TaxID=114398 RepID=A0A2L2YDN3_PARTP|nr:multifunctional methyltransferase subunit TRM112-like protein [Parasteatoda tepidariorum]
MKLLTHNFMTSKCLKRVNVGFPLKIVASEIQETKVEFNSDFISRIIPKLDWDVVCSTAESIGHLNDLPKTLPTNYDIDEEFLRAAHHVLLEVEVVSGDLICPETGLHFPVSGGIPNMLVNEDEV